MGFFSKCFYLELFDVLNNRCSQADWFCRCGPLVIGVFAPLIRVPMAGTLNSFSNIVGGGGIAVLVFALIALALVVKEKYR